MSLDPTVPYFISFALSENYNNSKPAWVYATRGNVGEPIITGARVPSLLEYQQWWFAKPGDENFWMITASGPLKNAGIGPVRLGFQNREVKDGTPVTFGAGLAEYLIEPLGEDFWTISPASAGNSNYVQTDPAYAVGVSANLTVEIQELKSVVEGNHVFPKWQIKKLG